MNFKFVFYCFSAILAITGGGYYFFSSRQETVAAIFFLGATVAALFFGFRWFNSSGDTNTTSGPWPPSVNYCPDFMTLANINDEQVCIDTVGVATAGGISSSDGTKIADQYLFKLYLTSSGADRTSLLCQQAKEKKVTWEGVWDGTTCLSSQEPPKPPRMSESVAATHSASTSTSMSTSTTTSTTTTTTNTGSGSRSGSM
jgi:hypothetical protein